FGSEAADLGNDSGRGDGDGARADAGARGMAEDACRADDLVVIEERLAHPHEDRASHRPVRLAAHREHLPDDLGGVEVAAEAELTGGAESAGERAARLGRDADDVLLLLACVRAHVRAWGLAGDGDADGLDSRAVPQLEEVLEKAVRSPLARRDAQRLGGGLQLDAFDQLAADSTHGAEVVLASLHGGGEQLAADLLRDVGTEERGGVLGQYSSAVANACRVTGPRTVS